MTTHSDVLILGAGIGGYRTLMKLNKLFKKKGIKKKITIIDKNNYFTFVPMLHEVASGSVQANQVAIPIRECIYKTDHTFVQALVTTIDPKEKRVDTTAGSFTYDHCVVSLGSGVNFFGTPGAAEHATTVRTLPQAMKLHNELITKLEDITKETIDISIVGGGATGVEVAGQFAHLVHHDIKELYPHKKVTIHLYQSSPSLVPYLDAKVQRYIADKLQHINVDVQCNTRVKEVKSDAIVIGEDKTIPSDITIWTAGFSYAGPSYLDESYTEKGQIVVNDHMQIPDMPHTYIIGDIAAAKNPESETPQPKLAQWAEAQGCYVAHHIAEAEKGRDYRAFAYKDKGSLIPIGDWYATAHIGPFIFQGRFAWWLRRTVYLKSVPGFVRKLRIVIDWTLHSLGFKHFIDIEVDFCDE